MHVTHAPLKYAELSGFVQLFYVQALCPCLCFPHGICPKRSKHPCRQCPGSPCRPNPIMYFSFDRPGRLYTTTVSVLLPPYNQQSSCSVTPLWKQKFDIGSTIYRRVVIRNPAALETERTASKAPFWKIF